MGQRYVGENIRGHGYVNWQHTPFCHISTIKWMGIKPSQVINELGASENYCSKYDLILLDSMCKTYSFYNDNELTDEVIFLWKTDKC